MYRMIWIMMLLTSLINCVSVESVRGQTAPPANPFASPAVGSPVASSGPAAEVIDAPNSASKAWESDATDSATGDLFGDWLGPPQPNSPYRNLYLFHGYSSWRGISEGTGANNNGFLYGANYGTKLGVLSDWTGIGAQIGASYGLYDLNGRSSGFADNRIQQQTFVTVGLFRQADRLTNFSGGFVYDAMINDNFSQFAVAPYLSQMRAQLAYAVNDRHEIGFWTSLRVSGQTLNVAGPLTFRPVDQFNFFWHHKFAFGGDGWTWIGFPDHTKLGGNGSLGGYIWGGTLTAPLSPCWAAYTDLQYMAPSARIGAAGAIEESFFIGIGLVYYPGGNSRTSSVVGSSWAPYIPVGNNGTFMVDTNRTF
jgi:hypothetical protein